MSLELLALGSSFLGGLMGRSEQRKDRALHRDQLAQAQRQFDAQMDQSVSRRVADAKSAGIHPLFAMGASVGASPTIQAGQAPQSRNPMGNALESMAQQLGIIEGNRARAKRDEAEAALLDSERARIEQETNSRGNDTVRTYPYGTNPVSDTDKVVFGPAEYYAPQVPYSKRTGVRSGTPPATLDIKMPDGRTVNIYDPDLGLDEIGQVKYVVERARHYAADAMMWASKNLSDQEIMKRLSKIGRTYGLTDRQIAAKVKKVLNYKIPYGD